MSKLLSTYVKNFQFFPKSAIYDADSKYRINEFNSNVATLYFIVRTQKARFVPSSFRVDSDCTFQGIIDVAHHQLPVQFNCVEMLYKAPGVQQHFSSSSIFFEYCMSRLKGPVTPNTTRAQQYAAEALIDLKKTTNSKLVVDCPVKRSITKEHNGEMVIPPYQLLNLGNIKLPTPLEIIYIGKSNDNTWKRIYNHNKWGLIEEHREETEELLVYFLEIDKSSITNNSLSGIQTLTRCESELSVEDATVATEAALINYFIKESTFNKQHVNSDITKSNTITDRVKSRGYTDLVVECDLEGPFGILGTQSAGFNRRHSIEYKL